MFLKDISLYKFPWQKKNKTYVIFGFLLVVYKQRLFLEIQPEFPARNASHFSDTRYAYTRIVPRVRFEIIPAAQTSRFILRKTRTPGITGIYYCHRVCRFPLPLNVAIVVDWVIHADACSEYRLEDREGTAVIFGCYSVRHGRRGEKGEGVHNFWDLNK